MGGVRVIALGVLLLVGCTTEVESQSLQPATTTSLPPATAPPTTQVPLAVGADAYTQQLVAAWVAGDRALATRLAAPAAMATLDAHDAERPAGWVFVICEPAGGTTPCTFAAGTRQLIAVANDALVATGQPLGVVELRFEDNLPPGL